MKKIHHQLFNNQSIELSSSSEIDSIIQKVDLAEVSKLIGSAISKKQRDQKKHSFLEKKKLHKRENGFTMNSHKYHITLPYLSRVFPDKVN